MKFSPLTLIRRMRDMREQETELAKQNPFLMQAMEREKQEGQRLAFIARTVALLVIMLILPIINPNLHVLYYEAMVLVFIGIGWLQYRSAFVGYSRTELALIQLDVILLTLLFIVPNPFQNDPIPSAFLYRFDNFMYFFVILSVATLAYSWRTVWGMGIWVTITWTLGIIGMVFFGKQIPELGDASKEAFEGYDLLVWAFDPNSIQWNLRLQEVVVFLIVAGILAIKGYRSNLLLMKQASIASERANLSRYFPSSIVDTLASTDRDIGAVRNQEVVVLFTDIVGFTKFAERNDPDEVMDLLRRYHALVENAVFENKGTLEKYMGDGVMATFGRPENSSLDAANALAAAQKILADNEVLNAKREKQGKEPVKISLGIHYGPVILGDIGPERRLEFAVVGDTVNVAARLEAESRELECRCVVSDDVVRKISEDWPERDAVFAQFKERGAVQLRGRTQPINIWVA